MNIFFKQIFSVAIVILSGLTLTSCSLSPNQSGNIEPIRLSRLFPTQAGSSLSFDESIIASPLIDLSQGSPLVIVPVSDGLIVALNAETGESVWKINAPAPDGQSVQLISNPLIIKNKLIILYQCLDKGERTSHRLAVIDLIEKKLDASFPILTLTAKKPAADGVSIVKFNPPTAYSHAAIVHAPKPGSALGIIYASFGNAGDVQPFHGWMFEIDMDRWQQQGVNEAVRNVLLTTPEAKCPVTLKYGTQEMICGGGIWSPAGPKIYPTDSGYELLVPTGNGQVDLNRQDYANALLRVKPGLNYDPECDANLCKNFNPIKPDYGCLASCKNLFIPRPPVGEPELKPSNRECEDKTFWECLAWMD